MKYLVQINILFAVLMAGGFLCGEWDKVWLWWPPLLMALALCLPFQVFKGGKSFPWYSYAFIVIFVAVVSLHMFDPGILLEGKCRYVFSRNWRSGWGGGLMGTRFLISAICWGLPVLLFAFVSKLEGWSKMISPITVMFCLVGGWLLGVSVALIW